MGSCPDYVGTYQAAKWMNVPPWELAKQSIWWQNKALTIMQAERSAQKTIEDRQAQQNKSMR